ncbi:MAG: PilT/PilU family type 4a pilus ATPase, partial [Nitrospirae bacterium]
MEGLHRLLARMVEVGASDLHLKAGAAPLARVHGALQPLGEEPLAAAELEGWLAGLLSEGQRAAFAARHAVDLAWTDPAGERFRVACFRQAGTPALVLRHVRARIPRLEELGLPEVVADLCLPRPGLVLITGPTGSGKSTTLAAMVGHLNRTAALTITTLEDPVEFLHRDERCHITQREIGLDAASFAAGMVEALRQDPDVILVGELRDRDTIATALLAAETGHLVLSTLHTRSAAETVQRLLAAFPADGREAVRVQLAACLTAVVGQRLIP